MRGTGVASILILTVTVGLCIACLAGNSPSNTGDSKEGAVHYYLDGEAAYKSKDYVTALAMWKTVLELKPSSTYTRKRIKELRRKLTASDREAYEEFLTAVRVSQEGWDFAAVDACRIGLYYAPNARCIRELYESSLSNYRAAVASQPTGRFDSGPTSGYIPSAGGSFSAQVPDRAKLTAMAEDYARTNPKWAGPGGTSFNWRVKGIRYQSGDAWVDMVNEHGVSYPIEYSYNQVGGWQLVQDGQDLAVKSPFAD